MNVAARRRPAVSVLIAARDAEQDLPDLLSCLERQSIDDFEVVLTDDASSDRTAAIAEASPLVQLERFNHHRGYPAALNAAARRAAGSWLALTDADCRPADDWLEQGLNVGAEAQSRDLIIAGHIDMPLGSSPNMAMLVDAVSYLDQERYAAQGQAAGANLWAPREMWERLGGFSERIGTYGACDTDFCLRATKLGCEVVYAPNSIVEHPPRRRLRDVARKSFRLGRDRAVMMRDHQEVDSVLPSGWRSMLPQTRLESPPRLIDQGHDLSWIRRVRLLAALYLARHLPVVAGERIGSRANRRR
jgi:glycosyltransferase involved in cell wall biosynthesis